MKYERYHTALVFTIVLLELLKETPLETKVSFLYGDILEQEKVPLYHLETANTIARKIIKSIDTGEIVPPSPFTRWQRFKQSFEKRLRGI